MKENNKEVCQPSQDKGFALFSKANILMMAGCVVMIIVGFALMSGPGSSVEGGFNPDIFSIRRIIVGPTIAFLGFLLMAFAIIYKRK